MKTIVNVLHVLSGLNHGGAESLVIELFRHIDRRNIRFDFIVHTDTKGAYDDEVESLGGIIYRCPAYIGKNHFAYCAWWKEFFKKHPEYDIIHSHIRSTAALYIPIAKRRGLSTIIHSHSTSNGKGLSSAVKYILQLPLRFQADYLFSCADTAGKWLFGKNAVKKSNYYVIKNAIDTEKFHYSEQTRSEYRNMLRLEDKFVIGHVGNFRHAKNHAFLVEIFAEVHKRNPTSLLILVGDGELQEAAVVKAESAGVSESVLFLGQRSDVSELMQAMDAFVFPSLWEGLSLVVIEAQTSGLRCIVSDRVTRENAVTDLVEFIPLDKPAGFWAERILSSQYGYARRDTLDEIKRAGYDIAQTVNWLEAFYTEIVRHHAKT